MTTFSSGTIITTLPTATSLSDSSRLYVVSPPTGTPTSQQLPGTILGTTWIEVTDTWTYASSGTVNIPTDGTTRYQKGYGIRFKQGGAYKYMYMTTVAATLLTVNGGTDYMVANSAITDIAYTPNPNNAFGFPDWLNYHVDVTAGAGAFTTVSATGKFKIQGKSCHCRPVVTITTNGTASSYVGVNVPVATADTNQILHGKETGVSSKALTASFYPDASHLAIQFYDGTYPGQNSAICAVNGAYEY